ALHRALEDEPYRKILLEADLCVPDGAGVVWAGDFIYEAPILSRIPGVELVESMLELAVKHGYRVYFLGSSRSIIERARDTRIAFLPVFVIEVLRDKLRSNARVS